MKLPNIHPRINMRQISIKDIPFFRGRKNNAKNGSKSIQDQEKISVLLVPIQSQKNQEIMKIKKSIREMGETSLFIRSYFRKR